jgi:hypothetical protein
VARPKEALRVLNVLYDGQVRAAFPVSEGVKNGATQALQVTDLGRESQGVGPVWVIFAEKKSDDVFLSVCVCVCVQVVQVSERQVVDTYSELQIDTLHRRVVSDARARVCVGLTRARVRTVFRRSFI